MKRRRSYLVALVAVALVIAGVVWFVVLAGGNADRSSPVVVSAPELEAAREGQRVFRIDPNPVHGPVSGVRRVPRRLGRITGRGDLGDRRRHPD